MNRTLIITFYALAAGALLWFGLLWACSRRRADLCRRKTAVLAAVAAAVLLLVPFGGSPLWNRAFSFFPNLSLPLLGVVCAALWPRVLGGTLFARADWVATWIFGAVVGSVLYVHPLVLGAVDLYYWGWEREAAGWGVAVLAVGLLACGNRLGVLLLAALAAYAMNTLESRNCWDYLVDPLLWLLSLGFAGIQAFGAVARGLTRRRATLAAIARPVLGPVMRPEANSPGSAVGGLRLQR